MIKMADTDQEQLYLCILKLLKRGSNGDFEILKELCKEISGDLPDLKMPNIHAMAKDATTDESAKNQLKSLKREDQASFTPVEIKGDGSCLFRALSFLCFGHENRHRELRVRCIIEMALNKDRYLKDKDLSKRCKAEEHIRKRSKARPSGKPENCILSESESETSVGDAGNDSTEESENSDTDSETPVSDAGNDSTEESEQSEHSDRDPKTPVSDAGNDSTEESEQSEHSDRDPKTPVGDAGNDSTEESEHSTRIDDTSSTTGNETPESTKDDSQPVTDQSPDDSGNSSEPGNLFEAEFTNNVVRTCNPDEFARFWHIQALGIILKSKIEITSSRKELPKETKELTELRKYFDRTLNPQDLGGPQPFVPLIPSEVKELEEEDSGLGESLNKSDEQDTSPSPGNYLRNEKTDDGVSDFNPSLTSTPKKAPKDKASDATNVKREHSEGSDDEEVDITKVDDVDDFMEKLYMLFGWKKKVEKLSKKRLFIERLRALTGPYQMADPEILGILAEEWTDQFVEKLIQFQFQIKWNTEDSRGMPEEFNFYDFCNVNKHFPKYNTRRAHVSTQIYREAGKVKILKEVGEKRFFCPDVYVRGKSGWVKICFGRKTCEQVNFQNTFSWMHESLRNFVADAQIMTLPSKKKMNYKSVADAIKNRPTLYWAVLNDVDFKSGGHLKLHGIGKTQVYVGKAQNGIQDRWINDGRSHSKQMMNCADSICEMKSFDVSKLKGIQLVDARLLLAKIRGEKNAVFLIKTFKKKDALEKGEKQHIKGKRIDIRNWNIVPYKDIKEGTWTPKKMEFGMNYKV